MGHFKLVLASVTLLSWSLLSCHGHFYIHTGNNHCLKAQAHVVYEKRVLLWHSHFLYLASTRHLWSLLSYLGVMVTYIHTCRNHCLKHMLIAHVVLEGKFYHPSFSTSTLHFWSIFSCHSHLEFTSTSPFLVLITA